MGFSDKLRQLRDSKGITQQDLASILNKTRSAVAGYESEGKEPDFEALKKLSSYFGVSIDYLLDNGSKELSYVIPILGTIRAGLPLLAEDNWDGQIEAPADLKADFALRVAGDSMSWVGIHDGDIAILRQTSTAQHGQIVAAGANEGEWTATLKFYCQDNGMPVLRAANPRYPDIKVNGVHRIIGTLVSIQKEPPSLFTYRQFLNVKESYDTSWNKVLEKTASYGLDAETLEHYIDMLYKMNKI